MLTIARQTLDARHSDETKFVLCKEASMTDESSGRCKPKYQYYCHAQCNISKRMACDEYVMSKQLLWGLSLNLNTQVPYYYSST